MSGSVDVQVVGLRTEVGKCFRARDTRCSDNRLMKSTISGRGEDRIG